MQHTRYLAEHIAGAKYIEFPDTDLLYFVPGPVVAIIGGVFGGKYRRTIAPAWRGGRTS